MTAPSYTPTNYTDNSTTVPVSEANLEHAENQIGAVTTAYNAHVTSHPKPTAALLSTDIPGVVINSQSGTSYTLVLGDAGKTILCTNASAVTLTVPTNASVAFPVGTVVSLYQMGAGQVTVAGAGGVTLNSRGGALKTAGQYAPAALLKTATDVWVLSGDVTA